ncbi:MAG: VOC family protein [Sphingomonadaceae bacterium]|nr:VOC family protein [Sphingomonadaceae bacterium]
MSGTAINGIHHVGMSVPSLERARAFYVDLLGMTELGAHGGWRDSAQMDRLTRLQGTAARMMFLAAGNLFLEMFEYSAPPPPPIIHERGVHEYGFTHLCIDVNDTDAIHARLTAAGMDFHCDPISASGVRTVYGRDPFGNVIELQQIVTEDVVKRVPALAGR